MQLALLLGGVDVLEVRGDAAAVQITAVAHDSRDVAPGTLFCCVPGSTADGHDFAADAVARGACALVVQRWVPVDVVQVRVASVRAAMGPLAALLSGEPSRRLRVAGVTGTNGKTTTVHLLRAVLEQHGWRTGVIGTLTGARTTPEAPQLQRLLSGFLAEGAAAAAMEVSSHALDQHRVDGTRFAVAGFTNLSQDHLDYHGDMESYFRAKARLFEPDRTERAVVNADDEHGRRLLAGLDVPAQAYSLDDVEHVRLSPARSAFTWAGHDVELRLGGLFNVSNALCAATMATALGVPAATAAAGLSAAPPVPGRFEAVDAGQPFSVIVDYAHTPDALTQLLASARRVAPPGARLLLVFGCGGDRDRTKRPAMGRVAGERADVVFVTSDNPRSEDPAAIIAAVLSGVPGDRPVEVEPDRERAITAAVAAARPGDVVLIAGKGHERDQVFGERTLPFDDRECARRALEGVS